MKKEKMCCNECLHFIARNEPCRMQPVGIPSPETEFCSEFKKKVCGNCCWFYNEDVFGNGFCAEAIGTAWHGIVRCDGECHFSRGGSDNPCFVSIKEMRHYCAVLLQANRYRKDNNVPSIYRMPNPTELGRAIDLALRYMKAYSKI